MGAAAEVTAEVTTEVTVLVVDDHPVCRAGLRSMLDASEFRIVAEAGTGREGLEAARRLRPELVLVEIRLPTGEGLSILKLLVAENPTVPVVVVTTYNHPLYLAGAMAAGAAGYLLKGVEREQLLHTLRRIQAGEVVPSPAELVWQLARGEAEIESPDLIRSFSRRETEVVRLLGLGLRNDDIARLLSISDTTVRTHVEHILGKLGLADRLQAAVWAARHAAPAPDAGVVRRGE